MELPRLSPSLINEKNLAQNNYLNFPKEDIFSLPEKVLQFGTGALIRGLPDYFIDKANKKGIFNGRIVVVKSTETTTESLNLQGGLFVQNIKGIENDINVDDYIINCSISRVIDAEKDWKEVLLCAENVDLSIIISNTTEIGLVVSDKDIFKNPPSDFPGKLTAFLHQRFKVFNGSPESGMVIIPTELIVDNGIKLKEAVLSLATHNHLGDLFTNWIETSNYFCNSLVDRIVPGKPAQKTKEEIETKLGFRDDCLIVSEPYKLWAIEGDSKIKERLSFSKASKDIIIERSIKQFRERKLRLLNGTHTLFAGLGFLAGFNSVKECMEDSLMNEYIRNVMLDEIVPSLDVKREIGESFAEELILRFSNPFIDHSLSKITLHYSLKMNIRNSRTIINYYKKYIEIPRYISLGFAGFLMFMKAEKEENGKYYGMRQEEFYLIDDHNAAYFYEKWRTAELSTINCCKIFVEEIIDEDLIWDKELKMVTGFSDLVAHSLFEIYHKGVRETLEELVEFGEIEE